MTDFNLERSRNRKRSQYEQRKNSYSSKFYDLDDKDKKSNARMKSNDKLITIRAENIFKNINNSNTNLQNEKQQKTQENQGTITKKNTNIKEKKVNQKNKENNPSNDKIMSKSLKRNNPFDVSLPNRMSGHEINLIFNGKPVKKSEEEILLDEQYNTIEYFLKSITDKNKVFKQIHENKEINYSSSNLGFMNSTKAMSVKSEEKNTKINLQNIMENDRRIMKRDCPCIILSDKINIENNENKLDFLIKIMEEYKDIIMEKAFCKNFQDRIILSIYISLSQISLKLYNCTENNKKFNNIRKFISYLSNNIKYDLFNNPNFTLSSINQKFIEIIDIKNQKNQNNELSERKKDDNSSLNFSTKSNYKNSSSNNKEKYRWYYDDEDEEIIYENFEDFNEFTSNDKDYAYGNTNMVLEVDHQKDSNPALNYNVNNINFHRNISNDEDNRVISKISRNKIRRNATHRIAFEKKENNKNYNILNHNTTGPMHLKQKEYNFQIIDINGNDNLEDSDESIDSEEGCFEIHENHKYDLPKLLFFEDHVKDKDKRKINKNTHVEIKPDSNFVKIKTRIKELNDIGFNNIITIINKDPNVLPSHELNLNPFEISDFIQEREKRIIEQQNNINIENTKKKEEKKKKNEEENKNDSKNESFFSKSGSFFHDDEYSKNKILNFGNDEDEDDDSV